MGNFTYIFWAYMVIWAVLGFYVLSLGMRLSRIEKRVDAASDEEK